MIRKRCKCSDYGSSQLCDILSGLEAGGFLHEKASARFQDRSPQASSVGFSDSASGVLWHRQNASRFKNVSDVPRTEGSRGHARRERLANAVRSACPSKPQGHVNVSPWRTVASRSPQLGHSCEFEVFVVAYLREDGFETFFGCARQTRLPVLSGTLFREVSGIFDSTRLRDEHYVVVEFVFRVMGTLHHLCILLSGWYSNVPTEPRQCFRRQGINENYGAYPRPEGRGFAPVSRNRSETLGS